MITKTDLDNLVKKYETIEFIKNDPRGEGYRGLDWSLEYDLAINGDPNDTQTAL